MKNAVRNEQPRPGARSQAIPAFLVGAALGVLVMWLVLHVAFPANTPPASSPPPPQTAQDSDTVPVPEPAETTPVAVGAWGTQNVSPRPAVITPPDEGGTEPSAAVQAKSPHSWLLPQLGTAATRTQEWVVLIAGLLLGGVASGSLASLWVTRRAMARMEVRLHRFEELAAHKKGDWLANLDRDLDGEWQGEP